MTCASSSNTAPTRRPWSHRRATRWLALLQIPTLALALEACGDDGTDGGGLSSSSSGTGGNTTSSGTGGGGASTSSGSGGGAVG